MATADKRRTNFSLVGTNSKLSKPAFNLLKKKINDAISEASISEPGQFSDIEFSLFLVDGQSSNSFAGRLIRYIKHIDSLNDANLSMKIIERNPTIAPDIANEKNVIKDAVNAISKVIKRRLKLRDELYGERKPYKKTNPEKVLDKALESE